jgi:hypothetical protein
MERRSFFMVSTFKERTGKNVPEPNFDRPKVAETGPSSESDPRSLPTAAEETKKRQTQAGLMAGWTGL